MMKTINKRNKHHINMSTIKEIVISKRQKSGANLSGADLSGANLRGADLRGADLSGADLWGTENIYVFTAYDTSKRIVYCVKHKYTWYVKAGCFWGTLAELKTRVLETHNSKVYLHNIALLEQL